MSAQGFAKGRSEDDEEFKLPEPLKLPEPEKLPEDGEVPAAPGPDLGPGRTRDVDDPPNEPVSDLPG